MREHAWYRQPMVWLMLLPPTAAVVGGVFTFMIAVKSPNPQVVDPTVTTEAAGPTVSPTGKAVWSDR